MKSAKRRNVDYSLDEMATRAGLNRKAFVDRLKRVCELYDFDICQFKEYPEELGSNYFFPPELADYLLILVKSVDKHPLYARNARKDNVTATEIADYNRSLLSEIDSSVCMPIKEILYNRQAHMVVERIAYWSKPMVQHLTRFLVNNITLSTEDVGAALSLFTKELDKMNFSLYRADYIKQSLIQANIDATCDDDLPDEQKRLDEVLNRSNVSMDTILATIIREEFAEADDIRRERFQPPFERIYDRYAGYRILGLLDEKGAEAIERIRALGEKPDDGVERDVYSDYFVRDEICSIKYEHNSELISHVRSQERMWKPIDLSIDSKSQNDKTDIIEFFDQQIDAYKQKIEELIHMKADLCEMSPAERDTLFGELQSSYIQHCQKVDSQYKNLADITDLYIGQALLEFIK